MSTINLFLCLIYIFISNFTDLLKVNTPDTPNKALLFSTTVWGALRGLETFSQLVYQMKPGLVNDF